MYGKFTPPVTTTTNSNSNVDVEVAKVITATSNDVNGLYSIGDELTKIISFDGVTTTVSYVKNNGLTIPASQVNLSDFTIPTAVGLVEFPEMECFTSSTGAVTIPEMLTASGQVMPVGAKYCFVSIPYDRANSAQHSVDVSKTGFTNGALGIPQSESFSLENSAITTAKIIGYPTIAGLNVRLVLNFYNQNPN